MVKKFLNNCDQTLSKIVYISEDTDKWLIAKKGEGLDEKRIRHLVKLAIGSIKLDRTRAMEVLKKILEILRMSIQR